MPSCPLGTNGTPPSLVPFEARNQAMVQGRAAWHRIGGRWWNAARSPYGPRERPLGVFGFTFSLGWRGDPTQRLKLPGWVCRRRPGGRHDADPPGGSMRSVGLVLAGAERFENQIANRLLRADIPVLGAQQREAPTFSVDGVLSGRERDVAAVAAATFPDREADELQPAERTSLGLEDHLRVRELPWGLALGVRNDPDRHDLCVLVGHKVLLGHRLSETSGAGEVRRFLRTPRTRKDARSLKARA